MFEARHLIVSSILICELISPSIAGKNEKDVHNLIGKRGNLYESLLPQLEHVKELKISNCSFQDVSADAFKSIPNLKKIIIKDSEFDILPEGIFRNCPKLKKIDIKRTKFHNFDEDAFVNLTKLEELEIDGSNIKPQADMLIGCEKLEELEWNQCELKTFNPEALNGVNLQELELKNNGIEEFSFGNFPKMTNLKIISLSGNPLTSIDVTGIQEKCPNLKKIKLKRTNVPSDTLKQLEALNIKVKTED